MSKYINKDEDNTQTGRNTKVLFITNIPSPYRVDFFNELGKRCALTVLFERNASSERDERWKSNTFVNFKGIMLRGRKIDVDKSISFDVIHYLSKKKFDEIVVANAATPTGMIAIQYMKTMRIPYWIEGDGGFVSAENILKKTIKQHFIGGAKGYFSTSEMHDAYYKKYTSNHAHIIRYPFSSIKEDDIFQLPASDKEKRELREKLGMIESKIVISVGQMIYRKGFDILFEAMKNISSDVGLYIIGGKPTKEYTRFIEENQMGNLHIVDFKEREQLVLFYRASDLFVLPTREDVWGLVVNEAMAAGLPIITTLKCGAGLELVKEGSNGFLVPAEAPDVLTERINAILCDMELQFAMANASLEIIHSYTIEKMADTHEQSLCR